MCMCAWFSARLGNEHMSEANRWIFSSNLMARYVCTGETTVRIREVYPFCQVIVINATDPRLRSGI